MKNPYPMAHKIIMPPGSRPIRLDTTNVAETIKREQKRLKALAESVPVQTLPPLVVDEVKQVGRGVIQLPPFPHNLPRKFTTYRKG